MNWRGPDVEGEVPTLGWEIIEWIEEFIPIPDGDFAGEPMILSEGQRRFLLEYYRLHPDADQRVASDRRERPNRAFFWPRGGLMVKPQKWGKGPFSAAVALAEGMGPVRFDGWNAHGEPVGRPWATPLIAITAQSEDQSKNVWDALYAMVDLGDLKAELGDREAFGVTRINLPSGGRVMPVTASAKSRQGARITFAVQDEVQSWTKRDGGEKLADTQYRSLAGMGGRFLQTCNAWDPNEHAVAEQTWESGVGVYKEMTSAPAGSITVKRERMRVLKAVYAEAPWVDLELISSTIDDFLKRGDSAQAERYFFNRVVPGEDRVFDLAKWDSLARPDTVIEPKERIVVGVDGARSRDAIGMVATDVKTGFQWPLGIWEAPLSPPPDYEHPMDEVDGALLEAFEQYDVWRVYIDPGTQFANIAPLMEKWQGRWGEKKIVQWLMNRPRITAQMVRNYVSAVQQGDLTHDGNETMGRHIANARRRSVNARDEDGRLMFVMQKEMPNSTLKIDGAAAGALSWEARGDAIAAGTVAPGTYDDPANKCERCGHLRRHHVPKCRARPTGHCPVFVEPEVE